MCKDMRDKGLVFQCIVRVNGARFRIGVEGAGFRILGF